MQSCGRSLLLSVPESQIVKLGAWSECALDEQRAYSMGSISSYFFFLYTYGRHFAKVRILWV